MHIIRIRPRAYTREAERPALSATGRRPASDAMRRNYREGDRVAMRGIIEIPAPETKIGLNESLSC